MSYFLPPKADLPESRHAAVGAWFFGPRAENFDYLKKTFSEILDQNRFAREHIYPDDGEFITPEMKESPLYTGQIDLLTLELNAILEMLDWCSVPFWSPRYNAHMSMETSMPSVIGYLAGLMHNQNNVATEASPITTLLETEVGTNLCQMLGYNTVTNKPGRPWGHITCGGSVANLESIWTARNLKFYPLSLRLALDTGPLTFIIKDFVIETCDETKKRFIDCTTWDLLNLKPSTVLGIPDQLYDKFGISQTMLSAALKPWSIQTVGKDFLEKRFDITEPPQMFVGTTKHYSWPKGAAIAGIGSGQIIDVPVDDRARMDPKELSKMLQQRLDQKQAVYSVVAIIGSTEHGACDPLTDILEIRREFQKRGLSFVVHCDGAWGGYFASCIRDPPRLSDGGRQLAGTDKGNPAYVPILSLSEYTKRQLEALKDADSITIDPHKSGYCPYPAGGMCYRDGRMRFLVTWTSPVVYHGSDDSNKDFVESIGVYGVEGSKPGAAAVGAYLSHRVIGLNKEGYGTLLGEAIFTCTRLYCHWATMKIDPITIKGVSAKLIVTPFIMLPAEREGRSAQEIEDQKQFIRDRILNKDNEEIFRDAEAVKLLALLGGDLMINAFACNFEIDGELNTDVLEANRLNTHIFNDTSITQPGDDVTKIGLYLTSTQFAQSAYKGCLDTYKRRMGLDLGPQDLYSLINVTMSPWSTSRDFVGTIADNFRKVAASALEYAVRRNAQTVDKHGFIIQGLDGDRICGVHLPMFSMANHRWQLIISCKLPKEQQEMLKSLQKKNPTTFFTFGNLTEEKLDTLIRQGSFDARLDEQIPENNDVPPLAEVTVTDIEVLYKRSLQNQDLASTYPDHMIFYAYSAQKDPKQSAIFHIDHFLNVSPNIQLNADSVTFQTNIPGHQKELEERVREKGCWFRLVNVYESLIQPLTQEEKVNRNEYRNPGLQFIPRAEFRFEALSSDNGPPTDDDPVLFEGVLRLSSSMFADAWFINMDVGPPEEEHHAHGAVLMPSVDGTATETMNYGLVAEYPNELGSLESRNAYQQDAMRQFDNKFLQIRATAARKVVKDPDVKTPDWAKQLCDLADAELKPAETNKKMSMRMYRS